MSPRLIIGVDVGGTFTDASLVLWRINPERPIGGALERLDIEAARAAIAARIGAPLGLPVLDAAEAVLKLANARMAGAIRLVSIERGHDPARFAAMPFGGGGALHAGALMTDVGLGAALVPRFPGVTSALGCVVADMRHDRVRTVNAALASLDAAALGEAMAATAGELEALLDSAYLATYGRLLEGVPVRIMNHRVAVVGRRPKFDMGVFAPADGRPLADCLLARREVRVDGATLAAPVYDRLALAQGETVAGPAILEQPDTTVFIDPGLSGRVDRFGNLVITRDDGP